MASVQQRAAQAYEDMRNCGARFTVRVDGFGAPHWAFEADEKDWNACQAIVETLEASRAFHEAFVSAIHAGPRSYSSQVPSKPLPRWGRALTWFGAVAGRLA